MAAVAASKPPPTATKMKKPSLPAVQTGNNASKPGPPSASPSSAVKRLPGQATPQSATNTNSASINGAARSARRPHRISTRTGTSETVPLDRKAAAKKFAEPYVATEGFIMKKFKGRAPSLVVHLHPTHFRFDQQDGSFSYQSEMRMFIEHLQKRTIPHDMLEELRKAEVQFYDGWLIVRIIDHKSVSQDTTGSGGLSDDEKLFSIHNHNNFITPSPYAPYPTKEQRLESAKLERQGSASNDNSHNDFRSDDTIDVLPKSTKPQPKIYHVALRPTELSRYTDMVLDAMAPDPKALNRKQSQIGSRTPGSGQPPTPIGTIPSTPGVDKAPPAKKQKLKIDPRDFLEYEARVVNSTAPPLFLDPVNSLEEAEQLIATMRDSWHDAAPPSPKSRKRTVAELAADDAHAKEQERFMLIMDERNLGTNAGANPAGVDGQAGSVLFQPRFEKFNALDNIKRELAEKKQRENERKFQEDEAKRGQQQQEEERRRAMQVQAANERRKQAIQQQQQQQQQQAHAAAMAAPRQQQAQRANGIPPQMQNQMNVPQASSPVIGQGTPHAASSPIVGNAQGGHAMATSSSQQGAGSPPRPGSAVQHAHPGAQMNRGQSNQGVPSRNGTPQLGHGTPGMRTATPVMRQGTPTHMTQASPHSTMTAQTPQMGQSGLVNAAQMPNGAPRQMTPQQIQAFQQRQQIIQQQQQQQLMNGPQNPAAAAQMRAQMEQHQAIMQRQAAAAAAAMQQGNTQGQHMSPSPSNEQAYKAQLTKAMEAQMQNGMQGGQNQGSPVPNQMSPQQQQQLHLQQQQAHQRMLQQQQVQQQQAQQRQQQQQGIMGQQQRPVNPQIQQVLMNAQRQAYTVMMQEAAQRFYGGNVNLITEQEKLQFQAQARQQATNLITRQRQATQQAQMNILRQQQAGGVAQMPNGMGGGQGGQINPNMAAMHQRQAAHMLQQQQLAQAQNMMAQQQAQAQAQAQQQYQRQLNLMQQGGGGQR